MNRILPQTGHHLDGAAIRVLIVDPSPIVAEAISLLLDAQPDMDVVIRAQGAEDLLAGLKGTRGPGMVALVAMELTGERDAYWLIHALREQHPSVRIAAFGTVLDRISISRALFVGADGFIDKRANPIQLLDAIRQITTGHMVLAGVPRDWLGPIASGIERHEDGPAVLTQREKEILTVAAEGLTAKEIGFSMGLAERTVTTHLANIYAKLGVGTRVSAVMKATNMGLINIDVVSSQASRGEVG
jgi:DNA-binding NarL/FixJ family response regulator